MIPDSTPQFVTRAVIDARVTNWGVEFVVKK